MDVEERRAQIDKRRQAIKKREEKAMYKAEHARKLLLERTPEGLYKVKFDGGGELPAVLKGRFTSIDVLKNKVEVLYGSGALLDATTDY